MDKEIPIEQRRRESRKKIIIYGSIALAIIFAIYMLMLSFEKSVDEKTLDISIAEEGSIETSIPASGRIIPAFEEIINSPITTKILEVYKHEGDSVSAGTPLLLLDLQSTETEINNLADQHRMKEYELEQTRLNNHTQLANLEMQVKVKEMDVNRKRVEVINERRLDSLGSGTGDRVREAELAYSTGCLELEQLKKQLQNEKAVREAGMNMKNLEIEISRKNLAEQSRKLSDARLKSPRNATLTYIKTDIGGMVNQGEKIAVIADLTHFKVSADIADSYAGKFSVGTTAIVKIKGLAIPSHIDNVTATSTDGAIGLILTFDKEVNGIRPGHKVEVHVMTHIIENVIRIKNGPYYIGPGTYDLFVEENDGKLHKRQVRLGESNYDYVQVISGVKPGEKVVISDMNKYAKYSKIKLNK